MARRPPDDPSGLSPAVILGIGLVLMVVAAFFALTSTPATEADEAVPAAAEEEPPSPFADLPAER